MAEGLARLLARVSPHRQRLEVQLGCAVLARLVVNTARRMAYPFGPALGRGLGVPLEAISSLIAINQATIMLSPVFGLLADRWGYRLTMLGGLMIFALGMLAGGLFPVFAVLAFTMIAVGVTKGSYDPALLAYVGEQVPFARRGLAIGLIELAWAGSSFVGLPLVGLMIDRWGWRSPFLALGVLGLLGLLLLRVMIPADSAQRQRANRTGGLLSNWQLLISHPAALGALAFNFLLCAGNDLLAVIYGAWLEQDYGLHVVALGLTGATVIGLAELAGEGLTAALSDRVGLRRAALGGAAATVLSYLLLPFIGHGLAPALLGLFLTFVSFEFAIVTSMSLFTETLPQARATVMSSNLAAASAGRMLGALLGVALWRGGGLPANALVAAVFSWLALIGLVWGWRGRKV